MESTCLIPTANGHVTGMDGVGKGPLPLRDDGSAVPLNFYWLPFLCLPTQSLSPYCLLSGRYAFIDLTKREREKEERHRYEKHPSIGCLQKVLRLGIELTG